MSEHKYKLQYKVFPKPEGISNEKAAEDANKDGTGACDAMLLASIIYPEDGSLSIFFMGIDGRSGKELADNEWFKVWAMLTSRLARSHTLAPGKRDFCATVFETYRELLLGADHPATNKKG